MNKFEDYANRIIDSLPAPQKITNDQFDSPLERVYRDIEGELVEVVEFDDANIAVPAELNDGLDAEGEDIENGILGSGIEALAFYKSIHYQHKPPFRGKWGIFIFDYALRYLAHEIEDHCSGKYSWSERVMKARKLLYFHERFHFRFDCWVIAHESALTVPLYENYRNSVYRTFHPGKLVLEESLANLHALSSLYREGITSFTKKFMLSQPGAYANIIGVDMEEYLAMLAAQTFHGRAQFVAVRRLPEHVPFIASPKNKKLTDSWCPNYIVKGVSPTCFIIPSITLPTISEMEKGFICSYLRGQEIERTDHRYYKIDNGEKIKIPNPHRKNLKLNEFSNIIKKAGLFQKDFHEARNLTKVWKKKVPRTEIRASLLKNMSYQG